MDSQEADMSAQFVPEKITAGVLGLLPEREREVLTHRFGLRGEEKTLEELGQVYRVTRERIRQIERQALERLQAHDKAAELKRPAAAFVKNTLGSHGGVMQEDHLLEELERELPHIQGQRPHVVFILSALLGPDVESVPRHESLGTGWKLAESGIDFILHVLEGLDQVFTSRKESMSFAEIVDYIRREERYHKFGDLRTEQAILAALRLGYRIVSNVYGEWGPIDWPNIRPRRMGDKAYLILKQEEKPLHFRQIAQGINDAGFDHKLALPETIHNELISDDRFVLVGRGLYTLKEFGYAPGTVADVVEMVLRQRGPMTKQDTISEVLKLRMVKPETVYLALTDKNKFNKTEDGRYALATST